MSADNIPVGEDFLFQFGIDFPNANLPNPGPSYLTSHGEGKQLTIEHQNINQQV